MAGKAKKRKTSSRSHASGSAARVRKHRARAAAAKASRLARLGRIRREDWLGLCGELASRNGLVAQRHGLPMDADTVDLAELVPKIIRFLLDNAERLAIDLEDVSLKRERERLRIERERLAIEQARGQWMPVDEVNEGLSIIASHVRKATDAMQRRFGAEALGIMQEMRIDVLTAMESRFGVRPAAESERAHGVGAVDARLPPAIADPPGGGNDPDSHNPTINPA